MLKDIDLLENYNQFWFVTITPYVKDIEVNVPSFKKVMKSFKKLADNLSPN